MLRTFFRQKVALVALAIATTLAFSNVVVPAIGGPGAAKAKKKVRRGPRGPQGLPGPQGPPGAAGAPATNLWAAVAASGAVTRAAGGTSSVAVVHTATTGTYQVFFNQPTTACTYAATLQSTAGLISAVDGGSNSISVVTRNAAGTATDQGFNLAVFC